MLKCNVDVRDIAVTMQFGDWVIGISVIAALFFLACDRLTGGTAAAFVCRRAIKAGARCVVSAEQIGSRRGDAE
jgi:hypothetical protein